MPQVLLTQTLLIMQFFKYFPYFLLSFFAYSAFFIMPLKICVSVNLKYCPPPVIMGQMPFQKTHRLCIMIGGKSSGRFLSNAGKIAMESNVYVLIFIILC